jgi:ribonuclease T1
VIVIRLSARLLFASLVCLSAAAQAGHHHSATDSIEQTVSVNALPLQARETFNLIKQHGPFPFSRDGVVFGNYEHHLPQQSRGYYHEYTVKTPGAKNRGARRIVCGPLPECYYSGDHYQTFQRIRE